MATPIGIQLKQRITTPVAPKATNHKPVKVTGILHFVENQRGQGVLSRHGAGLDGSPGLIVFSNRFDPFEDTGWWLVTYEVGPESRQAFAYLATNQGAVRAAIRDLRMQLDSTPEGAAFFQDEEIMAVAMVNFSTTGDGSLVGYYSQGSYGPDGMKVMPAGNSAVPMQEGWNLVALYEDPENHRRLIAEPVADDRMLNAAIKDLKDQLDMLQHKPEKQATQPVAAQQR